MKEIEGGRGGEFTCSLNLVYLHYILFYFQGYRAQLEQFLFSYFKDIVNMSIIGIKDNIVESYVINY